MKKGFTLVELLAVIAILAILVVFAVPNVLKIYRNSKERIFITEVQGALRNASVIYGKAIDMSNGNKCIDSKIFKLDLEGKEFMYYAEFNQNEELINLTVSDGNYILNVNKNAPIKVDDIGVSDSDKLYKSEVYDESKTIPECN